MLRILHIDDDVFEQELVAINLNRLADDLAIEWSETAVAALEVLENEEFDLLISDYQMPGMNGLEFLQEIRRRGNDTPLIFVTGQGNEKLATESFRAGAADYFTKEESFAHYDRLLNSIRRVVDATIHNREFILAEKKYKKLYENNIAGVFQSSLNGEMLECNSAFKTILGYRPDDNLFGFDVKQWYKDPSQRERYIEEIVTNGLVNNFELHLKSNNGNDVWLLNNAALLGGHIIQGTVIDITKRKKAELSTVKSEEKLKRMLELSPMPTQIYNVDGTLVNANKAWGMLWQIEDYQQYFGTYNLFEDKQTEKLGVASAFRKALDGETIDTDPFTYKPEISGYQGRTRSLIFRIFPLFGYKGLIENVVISTRDISAGTILSEGFGTADQVTASGYETDVSKNQLGEDFCNDSLIDILFNNAPDFIFVKDTHGRYLRVNSTVEKILKNEKSEILGKTDTELFRGETAKEILQGDADVIEGKSTRELSGFIIDDKEILLQVKKTPFYDERQKVRGIIGIGRDITRRHQREEELQETNRLLQLANEESKTFAYSVSHDLKAPIRHIEGFTELLLNEQEGLDAEDSRKYLGSINKASKRMREMVESLLVLSEASEKDVDREHVNFSNLAQEVIDGIVEVSSSQKIICAIEDNLFVFADKSLLTTVLENLLGNAVKFSMNEEEPKIEVGSTILNQESVVYIKDNGSGFDEKYKDLLFTPFKRLHGKKDFQGTGIGLAIVKRVINKHNGRIWAESPDGKGAVFYFTFGPHPQQQSNLRADNE